MAKLTAVFLLMISSLVSSAQQNPKFVYCDVIVGALDISNTSTVTITVDFGQKMKFWDNRMKDENGKPVKFNSLIDALNYMGKKGWEFVQSYPVQARSTSPDIDHHFLMKKPFDELDEDAKKEYLKD